MPADLEQLQRFLQAYVVSPGDRSQALQAAVQASGLPADAAATVLPSSRLAPQQRMDVYRSMYPLRMLEAMQMDYPAVRRFLGPDVFRRLVLEYVEVHPSRSWTLNRLGDHFADYLAGRSDLRRHRFLCQLARLEHAICLVFDEQETLALTAEQVAKVPQEAWERARLHPIAALRLLEFHYPVNAYLKSVLEETEPPPIRRQDGWVVVFRQDFQVWRLSLSRAQFHLLQQLVQDVPLSEALQRTTRRFRRVDLRDLYTWFQEWIREGFFQSVEF